MNVFTAVTAIMPKIIQPVDLFVCLGSATAFFPRGQLPKEDLRRSPSTTQATRHPRALSQSLFPLPPYFCHECILHPVRTLPCPPVLYIYPIESLVCFLLVFLSYTYIQTPQKRTPQHISNPTNKLCLFIISITETIKTSVKLYLVSPPVSSVPTCFGAPPLHHRLSSPLPFSPNQQLC